MVNKEFQSQRSSRLRFPVLLIAVCAMLAIAALALAPRGRAAGHAMAAHAARADVQHARLFARVAPPDPGAFGTNLEGASFDARGQLYFVNTTAPSGQPKLMTIDLRTHRVRSLYSDAHSQLNCAVFSPTGTLYVCDLKGRRVARFDPRTRRLTTVLTRVAGERVIPDDLAIDAAGDLYIADYRGTPTDPTGRILLRPARGRPRVLLSGIAHPNGIAFTPDGHALWITEDLAGTLDHVAEQPSSPASTTPIVTLHTAAYLNLGANAYADSLTTDRAGNVYMAVYGAREVLIFNPDGVQIGRVLFPASAPRVTHVAIRPGTREAYVTASGPGGGFLYTFRALAPAPPHVPSGG